MTFLSGSALAQAKIGTVDLRKLFDNYYKTKLAQASIQENASQLAKDDRGMQDDLQKANADYKQLLAQANDQAISADERDKRKQAAADKLKQMQDSKNAMDQFERTAQAKLADDRQRMRDKILTAIKITVTTTAKAKGCTLVIDTAAETVNGTPAVVYDSGENDLTDAVLAQLNAGATIDVTTPATNTNLVNP